MRVPYQAALPLLAMLLPPGQSPLAAGSQQATHPGHHYGWCQGVGNPHGGSCGVTRPSTPGTGNDHHGVVPTANQIPRPPVIQPQATQTPVTQTPVTQTPVTQRPDNEPTHAPYATFLTEPVPGPSGMTRPPLPVQVPPRPDTVLQPVPGSSARPSGVPAPGGAAAVVSGMTAPALPMGQGPQAGPVMRPPGMTVTLLPLTVPRPRPIQPQVPGVVAQPPAQVPPGATVNAVPIAVPPQPQGPGVVAQPPAQVPPGATVNAVPIAVPPQPQGPGVVAQPPGQVPPGATVNAVPIAVPPQPQGPGVV
ncbi:hypothetical protein G3576_26085, partial [Roseomonas stagni]|nr:hypothetical protein [Falsiroseomonas algicola]